MNNHVNKAQCALFFILFIYANLSIAICDHLPSEGISPLFTFGHSILDKNDFALSEAVAFLKRKLHSTTLSFFDAYYGITDNLTAIGSIPIVSQTPTRVIHGEKTGLGDIFLHINYALYRNETKKYKYRINTDIGIRLPTTTITEPTLFSLNTTSFFIGITQDATSLEWYMYSDFGALLTTKRNKIKFGNILFFNFGIGKIFCFNNEKFITLFAELSDFYSRPDRFNNQLDLTTGDNLLFFGPTLRFSYDAYLIQAGIQFDVAHHTKIRDENRIKYIAAFLLAYTF